MTRTEKRRNRSLSRVRVRVEHAISGVKRCRITKEVLRNTRTEVSDLAIVSACGLHNLRVDHRKHPLRR